jgi:hypothetical protein
MKHKILVVLVQAGLALSVSMVSVGALGKAVKATGQEMIPTAFVEAYAASQQAVLTGARAVWSHALAPQVRITDVTAPGGVITYGEALHPRKGQPDETPHQYLTYLSEVATVRKYAQGLVQQWKQESAERSRKQARELRALTLGRAAGKPRTLGAVFEQLLRIEGSSLAATPPRTDRNLDLAASLSDR